MLDLVRVFVLIGALAIVALGTITSSLGLVIGLSQEADRLVLVTFSASLFALTTGLGLTLAWQAWGAIQRRPSSAFQPKRISLLAAFFFLSVALGHLVLSLQLLPLATFPLFHVAATVLPPLLILALVARALGRITSWRDVTLQIASGAFLTTPLAFTLEAIAILGIATVMLLGLTMQPGSQELIEKMTTYLSAPTQLQEPTALLPFLRSPMIVVTAFAFIAGIIPLIEEAVKTVGVGLMAYRHPTLPQAFLWGLAGGAGFALVEGLLNAATGEAWAPVILLRGGATLLHCFTGALMGLAWYYALRWRRWGHCVGLYAASVGIHGLWNFLTLGLTFLSLQTLDTAAVDSWTWAGLAIIAAFGLLILLVLAMALSLVRLARHVRQHDAVPVAQPGHPDDVTAREQWPSSDTQKSPNSE